MNFQKHQKLLLWLANHWVTRWVLGLHRLPAPIRDRRIDRITENSVHTCLGGGEWVAAYFEMPRFANSLQQSFGWLLTASAAVASHGMVLGGAIANVTTFFTDSTDCDLEANAITTFASAHSTATAKQSTDGLTGAWCYLRTVDTKFYIARMFHKTDTSSLTSSALVSAASFNFYVIAINVANTGKTWAFAPYSSTAAATPTTADYGNCGTSPWATPINDSAITNNAYNVSTFNSTGKAGIVQNGTTKWSFREANFDVANSAPTKNTSPTVNGGVNYSISSHTGTSQDPYLSITYVIPRGSFLLKMV